MPCRAGQNEAVAPSAILEYCEHFPVLGAVEFVAGVALTYDNILEIIEKKVAGQMAEKALNEILADKELGNALQPDDALKEELGLT
jgi:hypothetical protein